jgi:hypothetical protein
MCATSQYLYLCSHPASYRFRTSVCRNPASSSCRIHDENSVLPYACPKCSAKSCTQNSKKTSERIRQTTDINIMVAKKVWCIPSRCFIDNGFQNLDPFGTGIKAESADQTGLQSPLSPVSKVPLFMDGTKASNIAIGQPRQLSPCCLKSRRMGAYQATRLEGLEDRQRGRIVDSFCGSWL